MKPQKNQFAGRMPVVHHQMVDQLSAGLQPVRPLWPPWAQWSLWVVLAVGVTAAALGWLPFRADLAQNLGLFPFDALLFCLFGGALLAAWGAIESSVPAEEERGRRKILAALGLGCGAFILFLLFLPWQIGHYMDHTSRLPCFVIVLGTGCLVWFPLAFLLARNAPLEPVRAGFGAGVAAFLVGSGIITLHCDSRDLVHILVEHFLPVLLYSYLVSWIGIVWLSKWKRTREDKASRKTPLGQ
jgi:hypothetical protein